MAASIGHVWLRVLKVSPPQVSGDDTRHIYKACIDFGVSVTGGSYINYKRPDSAAAPPVKVKVNPKREWG